MKPLRSFVISMLPLLVLATCTDDETGEKPKGSGGTESMAGEGGRNDGGDSGSAGANRGGTGSGRGGADTGGETGEAGTGGEPDGGEAGRGGSAGNGGAAGSAGRGGNAGGGAGGMTCTTVTLPLMNADFDDGASGWTQYDDETGAERPIVVTAESVAIVAESAPNVAHLGGVNDAAAGMFQPIAIPDGAVTMTVTGYRWITSQELGANPFDVLTIQLYENAETTTGLVGDFAVFGNAEASTDWIEFTGTIDVEAHAGDTMELDVFAETDGSLMTEFYVDSLTVSAYVCL